MDQGLNDDILAYISISSAVGKSTLVDEFATGETSEKDVSRALGDLVLKEKIEKHPEVDDCYRVPE